MLNYAELQTLLVSISNIMNDRPAGVRFKSKDDYVPVTVNQLLTGQTSTYTESLNVADCGRCYISEQEDEIHLRTGDGLVVADSQASILILATFPQLQKCKEIH